MGHPTRQRSDAAKGGDNGELKGNGLNSPFGVIGIIKKELGLTHHAILWEIPWLLLRLELADAPTSENEEQEKKVVVIDDDLSALNDIIKR